MFASIREYERCSRMLVQRLLWTKQKRQACRHSDHHRAPALPALQRMARRHNALLQTHGCHNTFACGSTYGAVAVAKLATDCKVKQVSRDQRGRCSPTPSTAQTLPYCTLLPSTQLPGCVPLNLSNPCFKVDDAFASVKIIGLGLGSMSKAMQDKGICYMPNASSKTW